MRQAHVGGDKLFVDYAGDTVPVIIDRLTGEARLAQIFVAVMGASSFTYVEATWTQGLADWIGAHTRAFAALGGVPEQARTTTVMLPLPRKSSRTLRFARRATTPRLRALPARAAYPPAPLSCPGPPSYSVFQLSVDHVSNAGR
jgi:transposase